jgi:hypothetical protein
VVPVIPHAQVYFLHAVTELAWILLRAPLTVGTVFLRLALVCNQPAVREHALILVPIYYIAVLARPVSVLVLRLDVAVGSVPTYLLISIIVVVA